jgi:GTP-binding protein
LAARKGKGIVILVNKWDLIEKDTMTARKTEKQIFQKIVPFVDVPILFVSVTEKLRIHKAVEMALEVFDNRKRHVPTSQLNDIMLKEIQHFPPPIYRGHAVSIKYITQLPVVVPSFVFYCNHPTEVKDSYTQFLENKLRSHFPFKGVPIRIFYRKK